MPDKAILSARLDAKLLAEAKAVARKRDETMSQVIRRALREYVESGRPKQSKNATPEGWEVLAPPSAAGKLSSDPLVEKWKQSRDDLRKKWKQKEAVLRERPSVRKVFKVKKSP